MTNEEAINNLKQLTEGSCFLDQQQINKSISLAIAALQADLDLAKKMDNAYRCGYKVGKADKYQEINKSWLRGVNEMKQMLIKDAVDAEVSFRIMPDSKNYVSFDTFYTDLSFNEGDKVKLIIIKEN